MENICRFQTGESWKHNASKYVGACKVGTAKIVPRVYVKRIPAMRIPNAKLFALEANGSICKDFR